jgi:PHD/YefM family antitoxin component YafN of YafNO toxin-antitoxin module
MVKLHPEILERDGKKQFVILRYEEYRAIREELEDLEDLRDLRRAKKLEGKSPGISFAEVGRRLRIKSR